MTSIRLREHGLTSNAWALDKVSPGIFGCRTGILHISDIRFEQDRITAIVSLFVSGDRVTTIVPRFTLKDHLTAIVPNLASGDRVSAIVPLLH